MHPDDSGPPAAEPVDPDVEPAEARPPRDPRRAPRDVLAVIAVGGALGAVARYGAALLWPAADTAFPWTTLWVNVAGCLVIGCFLVVVTEFRSAHRLLRPFFGTGVLGGFTTFSTYSVDIVRLITGGRPALALTYLAVTVLAALAAVTVGARSTRRLLANWRQA